MMRKTLLTIAILCPALASACVCAPTDRNRDDTSEPADGETGDTGKAATSD